MPNSVFDLQLVEQEDSSDDEIPVEEIGEDDGCPIYNSSHEGGKETPWKAMETCSNYLSL